MTKYEVWHEITESYYMGEFEADSLKEAEEKAQQKFEGNPPDREDYQENWEFIVSEAEE